MRIPAATYRLQFHAGWTLRQATELVPYLHELGISHVYASPLLKARPGSTHGYDVCDPGQINPEIGDEAELEAFVATLREHGMGLVLDIVPNHLAAVPENSRWRDVLEFGRHSRFADWFDIDWESPHCRDRVLLPVLTSDLPTAVKRGEISAAHLDGKLAICHFDHHFPICPESQPPVTDPAIEQVVRKLNSDPQQLLRLLDQQHYRLADWREADACINYRRFFAVNDLAGVRVELPHVFDDIHALILEWHKRGFIDGYRIDHPDGLTDPPGYLQRLKEAAPDAWIVVEKILETGEALPSNWPVAGTTGYDFADRVLGLFIDPDAESKFTAFYASSTGEPVHYESVAREKKRSIVAHSLAAGVGRLARQLESIQRALGLEAPAEPKLLAEALIEIITCFPVYRTYFRQGTEECLADRKWLAQAMAKARKSPVIVSPQVLDWIEEMFLNPPTTKPLTEWVTEFKCRFQQLTSAAMAKGVEDTAFYCFNRFLARNEVGSSPDEFAVTVEEFHRASAEALGQWPHAMLATSTHDTKRSEDVRARLAVLSEIPQEWAEAVRRWSALGTQHRQGEWPDRNAEYHYYQTLVGAWPLDIGRAVDYMRKAAREAKVHTTWIDPSEKYESALVGFVRGTLEDRGFVEDVDGFVKSIVTTGRLNSLAQTLLKLTAPGVPDIYQGTEFWDHSLVDPDNRRPVDFERRRSALIDIKKRLPEMHSSLGPALRSDAENGEIKLFVIYQTLSFRRRHEDLFSRGTYEPLAIEGEGAKQVCAFARTFKDSTIIVVVPRLIHCLVGASGRAVGKDAWGETELLIPETLPSGSYRNLYTGEVHTGPSESTQRRLLLREIFNTFPLALLEMQPNPL